MRLGLARVLVGIEVRKLQFVFHKEFQQCHRTEPRRNANEPRADRQKQESDNEGDHPNNCTCGHGARMALALPSRFFFVDTTPTPHFSQIVNDRISAVVTACIESLAPSTSRTCEVFSAHIRRGGFGCIPRVVLHCHQEYDIYREDPSANSQIDAHSSLRAMAGSLGRDDGSWA